MQGTGKTVKLSHLLLMFWNMQYKMNHPPDHTEKSQESPTGRKV